MAIVLRNIGVDSWLYGNDATGAGLTIFDAFLARREDTVKEETPSIFLEFRRVAGAYRSEKSKKFKFSVDNLPEGEYFWILLDANVC